MPLSTVVRLKFELYSSVLVSCVVCVHDFRSTILVRFGLPLPAFGLGFATSRACHTLRV